MAARIPVVATDVGGNAEFVSAGVEGTLIPRGNHDAFAAALLTILDDPRLGRGMGEAGRARVALKYQLDDTVRRYAERYAAAADRHRSAGKSHTMRSRRERAAGVDRSVPASAVRRQLVG
jgi:glycosyltransferase involved in cell wall biosynthesis